MAFGIHLSYFLVAICFLALVLAMPQDPRISAAGQLWDNVDVGAQQEEPSERSARHLWGLGGGFWGGGYYSSPYWSYHSYPSYGYPGWGYGHRHYWW